jgi:hypothetical protein
VWPGSDSDSDSNSDSEIAGNWQLLTGLQHARGDFLGLPILGQC